MATKVNNSAREEETIALPVIEPGAKSFTWMMGDDEVTVTRLKTGAALSVAKTLVVYLDKLSEAFSAAQGADQGKAAISAIQGIAEVLDPDELTSLAAQLLGLSKDTISEAPLEDTLAALAGAIDLNNVMRLLATTRVLGRKLGIGR